MAQLLADVEELVPALPPGALSNLTGMHCGQPVVAVRLTPVAMCSMLLM